MSFAEVGGAFAAYSRTDPSFSAQLTVSVGAERVIDLARPVRRTLRAS